MQLTMNINKQNTSKHLTMKTREKRNIEKEERHGLKPSKKR